MNKIELIKIIENNDLDVRDLAAELFPGNKHPKLAIDRVLKGEALLDSEQISKLSHITGIPIGNLFDSKTWKSHSNPEGIVTFTKGDYSAELNPKTGLTKISIKGSIFHESVLHSTMIPLSEYLREIEELINNHK